MVRILGDLQISRVLFVVDLTYLVCLIIQRRVLGEITILDSELPQIATTSQLKDTSSVYISIYRIGNIQRSDDGTTEVITDQRTTSRNDTTTLGRVELVKYVVGVTQVKDAVILPLLECSVVVKDGNNTSYLNRCKNRETTSVDNVRQDRHQGLNVRLNINTRTRVTRLIVLDVWSESVSNSRTRRDSQILVIQGVRDCQFHHVTRFVVSGDAFCLFSNNTICQRIAFSVKVCLCNRDDVAVTTISDVSKYTINNKSDVTLTLLLTRCFVISNSFSRQLREVTISQNGLNNSCKVAQEASNISTQRSTVRISSNCRVFGEQFILESGDHQVSCFIESNNRLGLFTFQRTRNKGVSCFIEVCLQILTSVSVTTSKCNVKGESINVLTKVTLTLNFVITSEVSQVFNRQLSQVTISNNSGKDLRQSSDCRLYVSTTTTIYSDSRILHQQDIVNSRLHQITRFVESNDTLCFFSYKSVRNWGSVIKICTSKATSVLVTTTNEIEPKIVNKQTQITLAFCFICQIRTYSFCRHSRCVSSSKCISNDLNQNIDCRLNVSTGIGVNSDGRISDRQLILHCLDHQIPSSIVCISSSRCFAYDVREYTIVKILEGELTGVLVTTFYNINTNIIDQKTDVTLTLILISRISSVRSRLHCGPCSVNDLLSVLLNQTICILKSVYRIVCRITREEEIRVRYSDLCCCSINNLLLILLDQTISIFKSVLWFRCTVTTRIEEIRKLYCNMCSSFVYNFLTVQLYQTICISISRSSISLVITRMEEIWVLYKNFCCSTIYNRLLICLDEVTSIKESRLWISCVYKTRAVINKVITRHQHNAELVKSIIILTRQIRITCYFKESTLDGFKWTER